MKRYLPNTVSEIVIFYLIFLGFFFGITLIGDSANIDNNIQMVILNYVFWYLVLSITQGLGWEISNESSQGTLEQLAIVPSPLWYIILTRMVCTILINLVSITILLNAAMLTSNQKLNIDLFSIIPIFGITLMGVFGVGYILAGITVLLKEVGHILQLFQFIIMAMTFIPLSVAPFLKVAPFMYGLQLIREIAIDNSSILSISFSSLLYLFINSFIYFVVGLYFFKFFERKAKNKALLGHY